VVRGVTLLASVDISTRAPWITQNEQHFVAGEIPHELDAQMEDQTIRRRRRRRRKRRSTCGHVK
jgi:hypothetical protein